AVRRRLAAASRYLERRPRVMDSRGAREARHPPRPAPPRSRSPARRGPALPPRLEVDPQKKPAAATLESPARRRAKERNHGRVVVGNRVDVMQSDVGEVVDIGITLEPTEEAPAAVELGVRLFAIHETDGEPVHGDVIAGEAGATAPCQRSNLIRSELV